MRKMKVHLSLGGEMAYARAFFTRLDELGWIALKQKSKFR